MRGKEKAMFPAEVEGPMSKAWTSEGKRERIGGKNREKIIALMETCQLSDEAKSWVKSRVVRNIALTFADLPEIMDLSGLSVRDLFQAMGTEIPWPNDAFRAIAEACERLPQKNLVKVRDIAVATTPAWCWSIEEQKPSIRLMEASFRRSFLLKARQRTGKAVSIREDLGKDDLARMTHVRMVRLGPDGMVAESCRMGISMHWVLGLDAKYLIYGTHPEIEDILDAYSFMQPSIRDAFVSALKEFSSIKEEEK